MYIAIGNMITSSSQMNGAAASGGGGSRETKLVFEVTVDASDLTFKIDTGAGSGFGGTNYNVSWGDGSSDSAQIHDITHTYSSAGTYEIKVDGRFLMNNQSGGAANALKITKFKNWGTAECEFVSLYRMFYKCKNMTWEATDYPNISNLGVGGAKHFTETFRECESILNLDLSNWQNTDNFSTHGNAFLGMDNLESLNVTGWDFSNSTGTNGLFSEIGKLTTNGCLLTAPNLNISNSSNTSALLNMFQAAKLATGTDFTNWTLPTVPHSWQTAFYLAKGSAFATIDLTSWSNKNPSTLFRAFRGVNDPTGNINQTATINLTGIDTSSCISFRELLKDNRFLTNVIGFSALDSTATTANSIGSAFSNCARLGNLNQIPSTFWQNVDAGGGTGLGNTFANVGVSVSGGVNPPNFGTATFSASQNFTSMFQQARFNGTIDTSGFRFTSVITTGAQNMFYLSRGIGDIDASNWGITSSLTSFRNWTRDSDDITSINFGTGTSTNDFSGVTTFQDFTRLSEVTSIDFPTNADFSSVTNMTNFSFSSQQTMSTAQYDNFLVRFDATNSNSGITLSMGSNTFTNGSAAATARANIIARGNTITDGGGV
jgi:hypothetical protein|tara:strand:- start:345 stop:2147 length:1803 start_codon:yes stop_codon:yes gene_type:complete